jgi:enoyl-CoA hydratase/carnithine racemase
MTATHIPPETEAPAAGLRVERDGSVLLLLFDRPERRNAVDRPTAFALAAALDMLDADDTLTAAVLAGAGETFCAGMDLKAFAATGERPVHPVRGGFGIVEQPPAKPIVAAVEGAALGGGFEIALACDLIVAGAGARFGLPEVRRGLLAAGGGLLRIRDVLPRTVALELALTGEPIDAERLAGLGVVNRVVPDGSAFEAALAIARTIAANAPLAVRESKRILLESGDWPLSERFERQRPIAEAIRDSADAKEGAAAFVDKRAPHWTGR